MWAVLGEDQGLCGGSWERIRAQVGGPGGGSGAKLAVLAALGASVGGLGSDQVEKWPKPEREQDLRGRSLPKRHINIVL